MDTDKFKGKYRIASARLASWDYGSNAAYFITICTHDRSPAFGIIINGQVQLTALGQTAWDCWLAIPEHFPFVVLGEFVVMPNHVHGIIIIRKPVDIVVETQDFASLQPTHLSPQTQDVASQPPPAIAVETQNFASLPPPTNQFGPQSQNLASIVRGYKIGVTKFARQHNIPFTWQARYHDHIIRNAAEHERIRKYIMENPQKWAEDQFYER